MKSMNLLPVNVHIPTHHITTSSSLLDLIFVNKKDKILNYDQLNGSGFSRHDILFLKYNVASPNTVEKISYRAFNKINYHSLETDIIQTNWDEIYYHITVDDKLKCLTNNIQKLYDRHVPLITKVVRHNMRPWFSNEAKQLIQQRDYLYKQWKRYKTSSLHLQYKSAKRAVVAKINCDKKSYYLNRFTSAVGAKGTWREIRNIGAMETTQSLNDIDVEQLNYQFTNINVPDIETNFYNGDNTTNYCRNEFNFQCVLESDVYANIMRIKSNSTGCDDLSPKFIKLILPSILRHVTHLLNHIITTRCFPKEWKCAKIIPIPKSNTEYRPIAILPFLSKVLERILHCQIFEFICHHKLLTDHQSGFRPKNSCVTALLEVIESIREGLDKNQVSILVLLDHSKAFDSVHHPTLCQKLANMFNFSAISIELMESYLCGRYQYTVQGDRCSSCIATGKGVPQGSILGPLLYTMYSNDLPQQVQHSNIRMYADDVQLYASCDITFLNDYVAKISDDLSSIHRWAKGNGLSLNPKKSKMILIRKHLTEDATYARFPIDQRYQKDNL
ncbi:uncharacterized protein LOC142231474 [Haematobia irritans]|uniref:uncharacterized protein LOC142231474 n=1 Tax=Haematobia irritans TaxID=7368 RepID=UPI003F4FE248